jgi:YD repeat-containing protein
VPRQATYDNLGHLITVTDLVRQNASAAYTTTYGYNDAGERISQNSPTGVAASAAYNAVGEQISATDGAGNTTTYAYDLDGNLITTGIKAAALKYGTHLGTPTGSGAIVLGGRTPDDTNGWMWDLTVTGDHDFYIRVSATAILVHNCPMPRDGVFTRYVIQKPGRWCAPGERRTYMSGNSNMRGIPYLASTRSR